MFKAKRFLAVIVLFFFAISTLSCGGGGGGSSGGGNPPPVTDPTPPPSDPTQPQSQSGITDSNGRVSFMTSKGQILTFEIRDSNTGQLLPGIEVSLTEALNNTVIVIFKDQSGKYVETIYSISVNQSSSIQTAILLPIVIVVVLAYAGAAYSAIDAYFSMAEVNVQLAYDLHEVGPGIDSACKSGEEVIKFIAHNATTGKFLIFTAISAATTLTGGGLILEILKPLAGIGLERLIMELAIATGRLAIERNKMYAITFHSASILTDSYKLKGAHRISDATPELCDSQVPPYPPKNFMASPSPSRPSSAINLTWERGSNNEWQFHIEKSLDGKTWQTRATVPAYKINTKVFTFSDDINILPNTTYYYKIKARNPSGNAETGIVPVTTSASLNKPPTISSIIANPLPPISPNATTTLTCNASDPDGDNLTYLWNISGGRVSDIHSRTTTWTAPSTAGTYTIACSVSDGKGGTASRSATITVTDATAPLSITTTSLSSGTIGVSYPATNLSATGGKQPYTWLWSGNTPPGLSLNTGGIISGTPTTAGNYNFTVQVRDSSSPQQTATANLSIAVNQPSTYSISGRVTLSGSGLSGVTMTLTGTGSSTTPTDGNGNYAFSGAANGNYTLSPSKSGYTFTPISRNITVNNANVTGQDFTATQTSTQPTVTSITPISGMPGQGLIVIITGTNFIGATSVSFGSGIAINSFTVNGATQITANISISSTATTGSRNVSVTTPAGTGTGNGFFTVTTAAAQSDLIIQNLTVNPTSGAAGSNATVSFTIRNQGSGTANASTTNIRINTSSSNVTTSDPLLASISTPSIAAGGTYNVSQSVTIPSGRPTGTNYIWVILDVNSTANQSNETNDRAYTIFNVTTTALSFTGLTPSQISTSTAGYQATLSASGTNFNNVNQVTFVWIGPNSSSRAWFRGDTNWNSRVTVNSDSSMTLRPVVTAAGDPAGTWTWYVTLTDTTGATASRSFTVTYTP